MRHTFYAFFILFLLYGCSSEKKADRLYEKVMNTHDEAMAVMGDAMRLENSLDENIDHLQDVDSSANKAPRIAYLRQLKEKLKDADEGMMAWMRQFDNEMHNMSPEQKVEYLDNQQQQVQAVKEKLDTSIKNAEEALQ